MFCLLAFPLARLSLLPMRMTTAELTARINAFRDARDWAQFHNPKDLAVSISIEAAELLEHFQWKSAKECQAHVAARRGEVADEIADVAIYLFELADSLGIALDEAMLAKLEKNALKYPVSKARGSIKKYTELS